jgi:hypothetical protein
MRSRLVISPDFGVVWRYHVAPACRTPRYRLSPSKCGVWHVGWWENCRSAAETVAGLPKSCLNDLAIIWGAESGSCAARSAIGDRGTLLPFGDMPVAATRRREPDCRQARELGLAGE